jgi:hypothetical protein
MHIKNKANMAVAARLEEQKILLRRITLTIKKENTKFRLTWRVGG